MFETVSRHFNLRHSCSVDQAQKKPNNILKVKLKCNYEDFNYWIYKCGPPPLPRPKKVGKLPTAFYENDHTYHKEIYILSPSSLYWQVNHLPALYHFYLKVKIRWLKVALMISSHLFRISSCTKLYSIILNMHRPMLSSD